MPASQIPLLLLLLLSLATDSKTKLLFPVLLFLLHPALCLQQRGKGCWGRRLWSSSRVDSLLCLCQDSSLPVGVFIWEVDNGRDEDVEVSIMFSLQNGTGAKEDRSGGHWNEPFTFQKDGERVAGVLLHHCLAVNPFTLAISAREKVKGCPCCCATCWGACAALLDVGELRAVSW